MLGKKRKDIFSGTRPATIGEDGETELPILYYRDECAYFLFTADAEEVQKRLPSDRLKVVRVARNRCVVALATYYYIHASVGSYGETVMIAMSVHDKEPKGPLPLLLQARDPNYGTFVFHCPVTTYWAMRGGRAMWNYPKFISNMEFTSNSVYFENKLSAEGKKIFDLRCPKRGRLTRDTSPQRCFLAQNGNLVTAGIPAYGICETAVFPRDACVKVYPGHPMSDDWIAIKASKHPFMTQHYYGHMASLEPKQIIETGIRSYEGHHFDNSGKDGSLLIHYGDMSYAMDTDHQKQVRITRI